MVGHDGLDTQLGAGVLHQRGFRVGIRAETIDRDHRYDAEFLHVLHVAGEIRHAGLERL